MSIFSLSLSVSNSLYPSTHLISHGQSHLLNGCKNIKKKNKNYFAHLQIRFSSKNVIMIIIQISTNLIKSNQFIHSTGSWQLISCTSRKIISISYLVVFMRESSHWHSVSNVYTIQSFSEYSILRKKTSYNSMFQLDQSSRVGQKFLKNFSNLFRINVM